MKKYFLGCDHCEPDLHVGLNNNLHRCVQQSPQNFLHEDDRCVAVIHTVTTLYSCSHPHLHGLTEGGG